MMLSNVPIAGSNLFGCICKFSVWKEAGYSRKWVGKFLESERKSRKFTRRAERCKFLFLFLFSIAHSQKGDSS